MMTDAGGRGQRARTAPGTLPLERVWPRTAAVASALGGLALGLWGVLRSPGGAAPPPSPQLAATWWRVAQVSTVLGLLLWLGLLAWRRHGPRPGDPRPPLTNALVAYGVPFGCVMGIRQAYLHVGGFSGAALAREAFWWGLALGLTVSMPLALWAGAILGRFLLRRRR